MKIQKSIGLDGWTVALQSKAFREFVPGTLYPAFGVALLWYRPERRLSVSVWSKFFYARNYRLWGPRRLSWERS